MCSRDPGCRAAGHSVTAAGAVSVALLVIAIGVIAFLVVALVFPERF